MKLLRIGRDPENEIVISDPTVSRKHAEIFIDDEGNIFLTDLKSTAGTLVNGKKISEPVFLVPGDQVMIGQSELNWKQYTDPFTSSVSDKTRSFEAAPKSKTQPAAAASFNWGKKMIYSFAGVIAFFLMLYFINEAGADTSVNKTIDLEKADGKKVNKTDVNRDEHGHKEGPAGKNPEGGNKIVVPTTTPAGDTVITVYEEPKKTEITYDFSCLKDDRDMGTGSILDIIKGFEKETIDGADIEVTLEEELEVGQKILAEVQETETLVESGARVARIQRIMNKLVSNIPNPYGMTYEIHLVESDVLNAFTAGGQIFIYSAMLDFCENDDELACIIGHEIGHNQLGHIRAHIKKQKFFEQTFGNNDIGAGAMMLESFLTTSFNQENEAHCDMWGIDLVITSGWDGCVNVGLWERMHEQDGNTEYNAIDNLFRSHPYSDKRAVCSRNHILQNYHYDCTR
ncbi:MAG: hypothetical protein Fur0041_00270 [Bacteroidia bacterium]